MTPKARSNQTIDETRRQVEARWHDWYGFPDYKVVDKADWSDRDRGESRARCIVRNDVPALLALIDSMFVINDLHIQGAAKADRAIDALLAERDEARADAESARRQRDEDGSRLAQLLMFPGVTAEHIRAMCRLLINSGDLTPMGARQIERLWEPSS